MSVFLSSFQIGSTLGGITALSSLSTFVTDPRSTFHPYSKQLPLGDGTVRGGGWATASWYWERITQAERDVLRAIITGQSSTVYIKTRTLDSSASFHVYQAVAIWPVDSEVYDASRRLKLTIQFQRLILQS